MLGCATQKIFMSGDDDETTKDIFGDEVEVYPCANSSLDCERTNASNKITLSPAVKFFWEYQYYTGKLICRHHTKPLIAYCINSKCEGVSGDNSMIRIRNTQTAQKLLLKCFVGRVVTMSFAFSEQPVLAVLDHSKTLYCFKVVNSSEHSETIDAETILLFHPEETVPRTNQQTLSWCPWQTNSQRPCMVSDAETQLSLPDDPSMLLAVSCGSKVEVIDVTMATKLLREKYPQLIPSVDQQNVGWTRDQLREALSTRSKTHLAYAKGDDHSDVITVVSISRECSCLATSGMDGKVFIYSLLISSSANNGISPVHVFSPHNGAPIYGMIFIDSDATGRSGCTWNYLLTGASFNRELCLWSCFDWECKQTIRFCSGDTTSVALESGVTAFMTNPKPSIIMALDQTASVVVASDITRRVLYVLEITHSRPTRSLSVSKSDEYHRDEMRFSSISEFLLTAPCILFALGEFRRKSLPSSDFSPALSKENRDMDVVSLEIHAIHTWYLLNGTITFNLPHRGSLGAAAGDKSPNDLIGESGDQPQQGVAVSTSFSVDMSVSDLTHVTPRLLSVSPEPLLNAKGPNSSSSSDSEPESKQKPVEIKVLGTSTTGPFDQTDTPLRPSDLTQISLVHSVHSSTNDCPSDVDSAAEAPNVERLSNLLPSMSKYASPPSSSDGMSSSFPDKCAVSLAEQSELQEPPVHRSNVSLLATLTSEDMLLPPMNAVLPPSKPVDHARIDSPRSSHDSALNTKRLSDPGNSSRPDTEYPDLESISPEQTKVDSWISSGFVDVEGERSRSREEATWPVIPKLSAQHVSASSSASSSLRATCGEQTHNIESQFPDAPVISPGKILPEHIPVSGTMDYIQQMLRYLLADTDNRKQQMTMLFEKLSEAQNQLEQLATAQSEMNKRLNALQENQDFYHLTVSHRAPGCQGYMSESEAYETPSTTRSKGVPRTGLTIPSPQPRQISSSFADANAMPEWGQQILLQLRSQQGDFARRCSHLEGMLNKVNAVTNDLNQSHRRQQTKQITSSLMDPRIDQLPKLTCDLIRPVLRAEMQNAFVNNTNRLVEPIQKFVVGAIQESLKSLPSALGDNINRLLRDKNFVAQFARSASAALSNDLANAYRDSLQRTLVPALDKNINRLFEELNTVFKTGTQQYLQQIEHIARPIPDATVLANTVISRIIPEINGLVNSSIVSTPKDISSSDRHAEPDRVPSPIDQSKCAPGQHNSNSIFANYNKFAVTHSSVSDVRKATVGCTRTASPAECNTAKEDPRKPMRQAQKLIKENKLVEALELALVSTNQELVLGVCREIDPDTLFGSNQYPIAQNVLLSLIHQLSCGDLSVALEVKLRYLQEAVLSLDKSDPTTSEHGPRIIGLLTRRLQNYLQNSAEDTIVGVANVSASLKLRVLKLLHAAKFVFDSISKGTS